GADALAACAGLRERPRSGDRAGDALPAGRGRGRRGRRCGEPAGPEAGMTAVFHPDGSLAAGPLELDRTQDRAGRGYSGLKVLTLAPGETWTLGTEQDEAIVLPLAGGLSAQVDGGAFVLEGRREVFTSVTDFLYLPRE